MPSLRRKFTLALLFALCAFPAFTQMPNPYGTSISLENAKKAAAPALAEARKNNWNMAVAIGNSHPHRSRQVSPGGCLSGVRKSFRP